MPRGVEGLLDAVQDALRGDERALGRWYREGHTLLLRALAAWSGSEDLAERIAEEVVWVALLHCDDEFRAASERAWLARVAVLARLEIARSHRPSERTLPEDLRLPDGGPIDWTIRAEDRERVHHAVSRLPVRYQAAMALRYVEGYTEAEVANHLGMSRSRAHNILVAARARVRAVLGSRRWDTLRESGKSDQDDRRFR